MGIAHEKGSPVNQHFPTFLCFDFKAPEHGLSKCFFHGLLLKQILSAGAELQVGLLQQDFLPFSDKTDHSGVSELIAVEPDVIRAQPGGQAVDVKHLFAHLLHFQPDFAPLLIVVIGEKAIIRLKPFCLFCDGGYLSMQKGHPAHQDNGQQVFSHRLFS